MYEKDREWDIVNYLDSTKDVCGYLEACLQEEPGDGSLLRLALSDIVRAKEKGNFNLETGGNDAELLQALTNTGHLKPQSAIEIARALELEAPAAN